MPGAIAQFSVDKSLTVISRDMFRAPQIGLDQKHGGM